MPDGLLTSKEVAPLLGVTHHKTVEMGAEEGELPVVRLTVREAAQKWLETYVATARADKQRGMAAQRVRDYLEPFMGYKLLSRV